jgi:hypothetical protein
MFEIICDWIKKQKILVLLYNIYLITHRYNCWSKRSIPRGVYRCNFLLPSYYKGIKL